VGKGAIRQGNSISKLKPRVRGVRRVRQMKLLGKLSPFSLTKGLPYAAYRAACCYLVQYHTLTIKKGIIRQSRSLSELIYRLRRAQLLRKLPRSISKSLPFC